MFFRKKQPKEILEKPIEIEVEKPIASSIAIKDLELGKVYYRVEVDVDNTTIDKIIIVRKGIKLAYNLAGWLLDTTPYNYITWYEVDTNRYNFNGDINDLLMEKHKSEGDGPFCDDCTSDSDYAENANLFFFDVNSNIKSIKNNILTYWQKLKDEALQDKKKYYDNKLNEDMNQLNKKFNKSMEALH